MQYIYSTYWSTLWEKTTILNHILHSLDVLYLACLELFQVTCWLHWLAQNKSLLCSMDSGLPAFLTSINTRAMTVTSKIYSSLQALGANLRNSLEWNICKYIPFWYRILYCLINTAAHQCYQAAEISSAIVVSSLFVCCDLCLKYFVNLIHWLIKDVYVYYTSLLPTEM